RCEPLPASLQELPDDVRMVFLVPPRTQDTSRLDQLREQLIQTTDVCAFLPDVVAQTIDKGLAEPGPESARPSIHLARIGLSGHQQEDPTDDLFLILFGREGQLARQPDQPGPQPDRVQFHEGAPGVALDGLLPQPLEQTRRGRVGHPFIPWSELDINDYRPPGATRQLIPHSRDDATESPCACGSLWYA